VLPWVTDRLSNPLPRVHPRSSHVKTSPTRQQVLTKASRGGMIKQACGNVPRIATIATGSADLLQSKTSKTHWRAVSKLKRLYSEKDWKEAKALSCPRARIAEPWERTRPGQPGSQPRANATQRARHVQAPMPLSAPPVQQGTGVLLHGSSRNTRANGYRRDHAWPRPR
jgi:hypothetical protein